MDIWKKMIEVEIESHKWGIADRRVIAFKAERDITVILMKSCIKEIKLRNLESSVLVIRDLEDNCSLVISKN